MTGDGAPRTSPGAGGPEGARRPGVAFFLSLSLLSGSALAFEVILLRLFSVVLGHHFAATVISLSLLGYGASGAALTLVQGRLGGRLRLFYPLGCALFGLVAPGSFALAQRLPFNPLAAVWEPAQWGVFAAVYLVLATPFFFVGASLGLALRELGGAIPRIYRADLAGAGLGAVTALGLLLALPPATCLRAVGAGGAVAAALGAAGLGGGRARGGWAAVLGVAAALGWPGGWLEPRFSEYKGLSQALTAPGARVVARAWGPLGHLAAVSSPRAPFRHAPGLSLGCPWVVPEQLALFWDGSFGGTVDAASSDLRYRDCLPAALPYHLAERPRVLVLGAGGGGEVREALTRRAERVDAVELDARVAHLLAGELSAFSGPVYDSPRVRLHVAEARAFASTPGPAYDLIQVSLLDAFGATLAGAQAASESFLYTVEAFDGLVGRLAPGGVLAVTRWLEVPPRGALKLFATAAAALERRGVGEPGERLAMIRTWNTVTVLARSGPFPAGELRALRAFCEARGFDLAWLPGLAPEEANRFGVLERPWLYEGAREVLGAGRGAFFRSYKFFVEPATDDRPYFFRTFKWGSLPELLSARDRGAGALVEWAYLLAPATLAQAVLAGALLILLPLGALPRAGLAPGDRARVVGYFGALGLAFLLVEVAMLHRVTLLLGHPVYAAVAALAAFLVFAGVGSEAAGRRSSPGAPGRAIGFAVGAAVVLALLYQAWIPWLFPRLAPLPLPARAAAAAVLLAPLAFFMGMPFPLGLRALAERSPAAVPWAWGVNGFASVVSAALAAILSVHLGFSGVVVVASGLYLLAAWVGRGWDRRSMSPREAVARPAPGRARRGGQP